jgi:hypothetical protein
VLILLLACSMADKWADTPTVQPTDGTDSGDSDTDTDADADTDADTGAISRGDLEISEIMANPDAVSDDVGEWFEVRSLASGDLDLAGIDVLDAQGAGFHVDGPLPLPAGGRVVLGVSADTTVNGGVPLDWAYSADDLKLSNDGDTIQLALDGVVLDEVAFTADFPLSEGASLSLSPDVAGPDANDTPDAWCPSVSVYGAGDRGTPGAANDACTAATDDADGDGVTTADGDCDDGDPAVHPGALEVPDGADDDCDGWVDERAPGVGDVVVTEIMRDPTTDDPATAEWFEVRNVTAGPLDLAGLIVSDDDDDNFSVGDGLVVAAGDWLVLGASADTSVNGDYAPDAVWPDGSFRLGNDADEIILTFGGAEIDAVRYDSHFPDDAGKAMNLDPRLTTAWDDDDADSWCNADDDYGSDDQKGTPGAENRECG